MKKRISVFLPLLFFLTTVLFFFVPFLLEYKLPIPADTIIGLYHPFRDLYAKEYPRGIPYKNSLITDPVRQEYPWRYLAISLEKSGLLPLWNPYTFAGSPLLSNFQTAAFYPLNILFFLLPFPISWSILVLFEQLLAGIFLYLYLRRMRLSQGAAALGSIAFAFSGFFIGWLEWNTLVQVVLWLPLILLAKEYLLEKFTFKWAIVLVFAQCAAFFAGHLQTFFYLTFVHDTYLIARIFQLSKPKKHAREKLSFAIKKYIPFVLLGCLVIAITAIQWIPTLQFILVSARDVDQIDSWKNPGWFIPWQNSLQFLAPDFFGNPATINYWGVWNYGEFIGYVGILPLIMGLYALFFRRDKKTLFFGTIFFLSVIFSFPTLFAKLPYFFNIPLFSTSQPTRLVFVTDFSLAILAALGVDYFLRTDKKKNILSVLAVVALVFLGLWLFILGGYKFVSSLTPDLIQISKRNLFLPTLFFAASAALLFFGVFSKRKFQRIFVACLLIITVVDLLRFSQKFIPFTEPSYLFPQTSAIDFLQQNGGQSRVMELDPEILPPNFSIMYHIQSVDGYDPLYLRRYGELIAASERGKPDVTPPFGFNRIITPENINSRIIDLLGVKYVLSLVDLDTSHLQKVLQEGQTRIYQNSHTFPRVFFVRVIKPLKSKQEAIGLLFDQKVDLHTTAGVEEWNNSRESFSNGSVNILHYSENTIVLQSNNIAEGFLVLTDSFYPTWHAKICSSDGMQCQGTKIYLTDYNFRGIIVPSGNHTIIFSDSLFL